MFGFVREDFLSFRFWIAAVLFGVFWWFMWMWNIFVGLVVSLVLEGLVEVKGLVIIFVRGRF